MAEITALIKSCADQPELHEFIGPLKSASKELQATTLNLSAVAMNDREVVGAVASNYLNQFALVACAFSWVKQLKHATTLAENDPVRKSKFQLARYFMTLVLPETSLLASKVAVGKSPMTEIDVALL